MTVITIQSNKTVLLEAKDNHGLLELSYRKNWRNFLVNSVNKEMSMLIFLTIIIMSLFKCIPKHSVVLLKYIQFLLRILKGQLLICLYSERCLIWILPKLHEHLVKSFSQIIDFTSINHPVQVALLSRSHPSVQLIAIQHM